MNKVYAVFRWEHDQDDVLAVFTNKEEAERWADQHPQNTGNLEVDELPFNPPPAASLYHTQCPNGCGPMPVAGPQGTECPVCKFTHHWPWPEDGNAQPSPLPAR